MADQPDIAAQWGSFDDARRSRLLQRMTPDQKKQLRTALESKSSPAAPIAPAGPTLGDKVNRSLQPRTEGAYGLPATGNPMVSNTDRAAGRVIAGIPGFVSDLWSAVKYTAETGQGGEQILDLLNPLQVPQGIKEQYDADMKSGNPKLAADNLKGTLVGLGLVGAATHGAGEIASRGAEKVGNVAKTVSLPESTRNVIRNTVGTFKNTRSVVEKYGKDSEKVADQNKSATEGTLADRGNTDQANVAAKSKVATKNAKALADHLDATRKVDADNARALAEHRENVDSITRQNEAAKAAIDARQGLETKVAESSKALDQKYEAAEKKAKADVDDAYATVRKKVGDAAATVSDLGDAEKIAARSLSGSQDSLNEFKAIVGRDAPLGEKSGGAINRAGEAPEKAASYFDRIKKQGNRSTVPVTWENLQTKYSALGEALSKGNLKPDVYRAVKAYQQALGDVMHKVAESKGAGGDWDRARALATQRFETFSDSPNEPATVASKSLAETAPEHVKEKARQERLEKVAQYDPSIKDHAEAIRDARERLKALPPEQTARGSIKEIPEPPAPKPHPKLSLDEAPAAKPYPEPRANEARPSAPNLSVENRQFIEDRLRQYGTAGAWVLRAIVGAGLTGLTREGGFSTFGETFVAGQLAVSLLTEALRSDSVLDWLSKPSKEDLRMIDSLPPEDAARMRQAIGHLEQAEAAKNPSKAKRTKIAPVMAAWLAGQSVGPQTKKLQDISKKHRD